MRLLELAAALGSSLLCIRAIWARTVRHAAEPFTRIRHAVAAAVPQV
jgi:hypothetical protein